MLSWREERFLAHYVIRNNNRVLSLSPRKEKIPTLFYSKHRPYFLNWNFPDFLWSLSYSFLKGHELCHNPERLYSSEVTDSWKVHIFSSCPKMISLYTFSRFSNRHVPFLWPLTFPDVWPQKKKRLDCRMMATPGVSTVNCITARHKEKRQIKTPSSLWEACTRYREW